MFPKRIQARISAGNDLRGLPTTKHLEFPANIPPSSVPFLCEELFYSQCNVVVTPSSHVKCMACSLPCSYWICFGWIGRCIWGKVIEMLWRNEIWGKFPVNATCTSCWILFHSRFDEMWCKIKKRTCFLTRMKHFVT